MQHFLKLYIYIYIYIYMTEREGYKHFFLIYIKYMNHFREKKN